MTIATATETKNDDFILEETVNEADTSELTETIRTIISEVADIDASEIQGNTHFVEDLEMDSLIALEVIALIEQKYKIKIPEEDLMEISCLDNAVKVASKYIEEINNAA